MYAVAKRQAAQAKADKAEMDRRRRALEPLSAFHKRAQRAFNTYIRVRDQHRPCVSCGKSAYRGKRDAGHFRTVAAAPQLRYYTLQVWGQCHSCNTAKSGNIGEYRPELIRRIGLEKVEAIEANEDPGDYTREYLERLTEIFWRRSRHLEKVRAAMLARDRDF